MSHLKQDMFIGKELSDEEASAISGGIWNCALVFDNSCNAEAERSLKAQGITSDEDLYPGLGMQADNETPLT